MAEPAHPAIPAQRQPDQRRPEQRQPERAGRDRPLRVLTVDPGSASLKLAVLDGETLRFGHTLPDGSAPCWPEFQDLVLRYDPIDAIAIRFGNGGDRPGPVLLDDSELADLERLTPRQQQSVELARMVRHMVPDVPVVGCFDTSFHIGLPEHAAPRAGPPAPGRAGGYGLSCEYAHRRAAALLRQPMELLGLVVAHIGAGVSVTAIEGGRSVDTVTEPAGLAGLAGGSGDFQAVLAARAAGDPAAAIAVRTYLRWLRHEIAAVATSVASLDAVVLTGGVAENSAWLRSEVIGGLGAIGARLDHCRNREASHDVLLSQPGERIAVLLIQAREDVVLARAAAAVLAHPLADPADPGDAADRRNGERAITVRSSPPH